MPAALFRERQKRMDVKQMHKEIFRMDIQTLMEKSEASPTKGEGETKRQ